MSKNLTEDLAPLGQEIVPPEEAATLQEMITAMQAGAGKPLGPNGLSLRQGHAYMHGCVKAVFKVDAGLPEALKVGVFKNEVSYPAWLRFSNASASPVKTPDTAPDMRGLGIKLMKVPGRKILETEKDAETQDFSLLTHPTFTSRNVAEFSGFVKAVSNPDQAVQGAYFGNPANTALLGRLGAANKVHRHLLEETYFSTTPYRLGGEGSAIKFQMRPSSAKPLEVVSITDDNYLRSNLVKTLAEQAVIFDFLIQFQANAATEPIEDPTVEWKTEWLKVATITLPVQVFDTPEQNKLGESLSFSPWHSLPEHAPLGGINRARKPLYEVLAALRDEQSGLPHQEPRS